MLYMQTNYPTSALQYKSQSDSDVQVLHNCRCFTFSVLYLPFIPFVKNELFLKKEKSSFGEIISGVGRLHPGVKFRPPSVFILSAS